MNKYKNIKILSLGGIVLDEAMQSKELADDAIVSAFLAAARKNVLWLGSETGNVSAKVTCKGNWLSVFSFDSPGRYNPKVSAGQLLAAIKDARSSGLGSIVKRVTSAKSPIISETLLDVSMIEVNAQPSGFDFYSLDGISLLIVAEMNDRIREGRPILVGDIYKWDSLFWNAVSSLMPLRAFWFLLHCVEETGVVRNDITQEISLGRSKDGYFDVNGTARGLISAHPELYSDTFGPKVATMSYDSYVQSYPLAVHFTLWRKLLSYWNSALYTPTPMNCSAQDLSKPGHLKRMRYWPAIAGAPQLFNFNVATRVWNSTLPSIASRIADAYVRLTGSNLQDAQLWASGVVAERKNGTKVTMFITRVADTDPANRSILTQSESAYGSADPLFVVGGDYDPYKLGKENFDDIHLANKDMTVGNTRTDADPTVPLFLDIQ